MAATYWLPRGGVLRELKLKDSVNDLLSMELPAVLDELDELIKMVAERMSYHSGTRRRGVSAVQWDTDISAQEWVCGQMYRLFADVAGARSFVCAFYGYWMS